ncbi:translation machinery-associated protein 16 [Piptocephalis cylindrospora]|uniref:Translation machinery-associated protein 16 n=1 Tax=Piptocephalis cylindrospora TaxID=1907219 RepID=A0A4P9XYN3_9FUNG|nr:translation machinery-associated protein 16 [Piptocephalis cylindrospora]|eukprot:RKP11222.1 translation machinery-associated protein 16 [Piptocephalis cylindrospora]
MPGNRKITLKTIKNREKAHPFSRKANQMNRVFLRSEKLQKAKSARLGHMEETVQRFLAFRDALSPETITMTREEMRQVLETYVSRYDEEMFQLEADRRPGRPKTGRETELELLRLRETESYASGLDVPNLTSPSMVKILRGWDGDHNSITRFRTIRLSASASKDKKTGKGEEEEVMMK